MKPSRSAIPDKRRESGVLIGIVVRLSVLLFASLLFAASFPNQLFKNGLPFLAWIAFVPVFWVVNRSGWLASVLYGAFYGYVAYGLFNYWLSVFHPLAGLIVGSIYLVYLAFLFPLLKLADVLFPRRAYLVQWLIWLGYEYLRTQGFLGYAYGISGYTQWSFIPIIQIASLFGVWGVCALVVFPSAYLGSALKNGFSGFFAFMAKNRIAPAIWAGALIASLVFGVLSQVDYSDSPVRQIAMIQHNNDPWQGGIEAYRENFRTLKRLSDEALAADPRPELVVWSETAFVPRIYWHTTYRDDAESYALVKELTDYLSTKDVPFLIGNDDGRKEVGPTGDWERVDYNAVMLFDKGKEIAAYRKLHLVPFTEHFPYEKQLPAIHAALEAADTHFWKKGTEPTVFTAAGMRFSTPICFEDTFGYLSRRFVRNGAEVIINLTNDAWANSLSAQMQHSTMAIFRAIENRRSVVRSTASGQTWAIDPNGRIIAQAEPFAQTWKTASVPVYTRTTAAYTLWGDLPVQLILVFACILMLYGLVRLAFRKKRA